MKTAQNPSMKLEDCREEFPTEAEKDLFLRLPEEPAADEPIPEDLETTAELARKARLELGEVFLLLPCIVLCLVEEEETHRPRDSIKEC